MKNKSIIKTGLSTSALLTALSVGTVIPSFIVANTTEVKAEAESVNTNVLFSTKEHVDILTGKMVDIALGNTKIADFDATKKSIIKDNAIKTLKEIISEYYGNKAAAELNKSDNDNFWKLLAYAAGEISAPDNHKFVFAKTTGCTANDKSFGSDDCLLSGKSDGTNELVDKADNVSDVKNFFPETQIEIKPAAGEVSAVETVSRQSLSEDFFNTSYNNLWNLSIDDSNRQRSFYNLGVYIGLLPSYDSETKKIKEEQQKDYEKKARISFLKAVLPESDPLSTVEKIEEASGNPLSKTWKGLKEILEKKETYNFDTKISSVMKTNEGHTPEPDISKDFLYVTKYKEDNTDTPEEQKAQKEGKAMLLSQVNEDQFKSLLDFYKVKGTNGTKDSISNEILNYLAAAKKDDTTTLADSDTDAGANAGKPNPEIVKYIQVLTSEEVLLDAIKNINNTPESSPDIGKVYKIEDGKKEDSFDSLFSATKLKPEVGTKSGDKYTSESGGLIYLIQNYTRKGDGLDNKAGNDVLDGSFCQKKTVDDANVSNCKGVYPIILLDKTNGNTKELQWAKHVESKGFGVANDTQKTEAHKSLQKLLEHYIAGTAPEQLVIIDYSHEQFKSDITKFISDRLSDAAVTTSKKQLTEVFTDSLAKNSNPNSIRSLISSLYDTRNYLTYSGDKSLLIEKAKEKTAGENKKPTFFSFGTDEGSKHNFLATHTTELDIEKSWEFIIKKELTDDTTVSGNGKKYEGKWKEILNHLYSTSFEKGKLSDFIKPFGEVDGDYDTVTNSLLSTELASGKSETETADTIKKIIDQNTFLDYEEAFSDIKDQNQNVDYDYFTSTASGEANLDSLNDKVKLIYSADDNTKLKFRPTLENEDAEFTIKPATTSNPVTAAVTAKLNRWDLLPIITKKDDTRSVQFLKDLNDKTTEAEKFKKVTGEVHGSGLNKSIADSLFGIDRHSVLTKEGTNESFVIKSLTDNTADSDKWVKGLAYTIGTPFKKVANDVSIDAAVAYDNKKSLGKFVDILAQVYKLDGNAKLGNYRDLFAKDNGTEFDKDSASTSVKTLQYKKDKAGLKGEDDANKTSVAKKISDLTKNEKNKFFGERSGSRLLSAKTKKTDNSNVEVKFAKLLRKETISGDIIKGIIFDSNKPEFVQALADFLEKNLDQAAKVAKSLKLPDLLDTTKADGTANAKAEADSIVNQASSENAGAEATLEGGVEAIWKKIQEELAKTQGNDNSQSKYKDHVLVEIIDGNYAFVKDAKKSEDDDKYKYSQIISKAVKDACGLSGDACNAKGYNKSIIDTITAVTKKPTIAKVVTDLVKAVGIAKSTDTDNIDSIVIADDKKVDSLDKLFDENSILTEDNSGTKFLEADTNKSILKVKTPTLTVREDSNTPARIINGIEYKIETPTDSNAKKYLVSGTWDKTSTRDARKVAISDIRKNSGDYAEIIRPFVKDLAHDRRIKIDSTAFNNQSAENRLKTVFRVHETDANAAQKVAFNSAESIDSIFKHLLKSEVGLERVAGHAYAEYATTGNNKAQPNDQHKLGDKLVQLVRRELKPNTDLSNISDDSYDYFYVWTLRPTAQVEGQQASDAESTPIDPTKLDISDSGTDKTTILKTGRKMISEISLEEWKKIATGEYGFAFDGKKFGFVGKKIEDVLGLPVGMDKNPKSSDDGTYHTYTLLSKLKFFGLPAGSDGDDAHRVSLKKLKDLINKNSEALTKEIKSKVSKLEKSGTPWSFRILDVLRSNQAIKAALGDKKVGVKVDGSWKQVVPMLDSTSITDYSQYLDHLLAEILKVKEIYNAIPRFGALDVVKRLSSIEGFAAKSVSDNSFIKAADITKSELHKYFGDAIFRIGNKEIDNTISIAIAQNGDSDGQAGKKISDLLQLSFKEVVLLADKDNDETSEAQAKEAEDILNAFYKSENGQAILGKTNESQFDDTWTHIKDNGKPLNTASRLTFTIPEDLQEEDKYDNLLELLIGSKDKDSFVDIDNVQKSFYGSFKKVSIGNDEYRPADFLTKKEVRKWLELNVRPVSEKIIQDTDGFRAHVVKLIKTQETSDVADLVYKFIEDDANWFESTDSKVSFKKAGGNSVKVSESDIFKLLKNSNENDDDSDDKKKVLRFRILFDKSAAAYSIINTANASTEQVTLKFVFENGNNDSQLGEGRKALAEFISEKNGDEDTVKKSKKQKFLYHAIRNPEFVSLIGKNEAKIEADNFVKSLVDNNPDVNHGLSIFTHDEVFDSVDLFNKKFSNEQLTNAKQAILFGNNFIGSEGQEETMKYFQLIKTDAFEPTRNRLERWNISGNKISKLDLVKDALNCRCGTNYDSGFLINDSENSKLQDIINKLSDPIKGGLSIGRSVLYVVKTKKADNNDTVNIGESTVNKYDSFRLSAGRDSVQDNNKYVDRIHYETVIEKAKSWAAEKVKQNGANTNYDNLSPAEKVLANKYVKDIVSKIVAEALYIEGVYAPEVHGVINNLYDISSTIISNGRRILDTNNDSNENHLSANVGINPIFIKGNSNYLGVFTGLDLNGRNLIHANDDSSAKIGFNLSIGYNSGSHASSRGNSKFADYIGSSQNEEGNSVNENARSNFASRGISSSGNAFIKYYGSEYDIQLGTYVGIINNNIERENGDNFRFNSYSIGSSGKITYKGFSSDYGLTGALLLDGRFVNNQTYAQSKSLIEGDVNKVKAIAEVSLKYEKVIESGIIDLIIKPGIEADYNLEDEIILDGTGSAQIGYSFKSGDDSIARISFAYDFKYNGERLSQNPKVEFSIDLNLS